MFQANVIRELINLHFSGKSVLKCCGIDMSVTNVFFFFFKKKLSVWLSLLKCGTWHGLVHGKLISGFAQTGNEQKSPLQREWGEHTFIEPLLTSFEAQYKLAGSLCMAGGWWGAKSKADIWCCRQLEKPWLAGWQGPGVGLIYKFAPNRQHIITMKKKRENAKKLPLDCY